mgnify:CR=1 FL=1
MRIGVLIAMGILVFLPAGFLFLGSICAPTDTEGAMICMLLVMALYVVMIVHTGKYK